MKLDLTGWIPRPGRARTKRQLVVVAVLHFALVIGCAAVVLDATAPLRDAPETPEVPSGITDEDRFGLTLEERRAIFTRVTRGEPGYRARAATRFPDHAFSISDDRAWGEMHDARLMDRQRDDLSISQIYLILDEGVRRRWPGPDGEPLEATVPPLDPRR